MGFRRFSILGILILAMAMIIACGEGDTPSPTAAPASAPEATATPVPATTSAATPDAASPTTAPAPAATSAPTSTPSPATPTAVPTTAPATPVPAMQPMGTLDVSVGALGAPIFVLKNQFFSASRFDGLTTHESPFARDPEGAVVPLLVKNWTVDPQGLVYTFSLQENVPWHTGHGEWGEVDADDFIFTLENTVAEGSIHTNARDIGRTFYCDGCEVVKTGDMTVQLTRPAPTPRITWDLTAPSGSTALHSKKHYDAVGEEEADFQSVGTGPWELVEATSDVSRTVRAVPDHWRKTPEWELMVWHDITEESTRLANFIVGDLDAALYNPDSIQAIKDENIPGVEFMTFPGENSFYLNLFGQQYNMDHPAHLPGPSGEAPRVPLGENAYDCNYPWVSCDRDVNSAEWANARKVREAMTIAIDRQKLVNNLAFGEGAPVYINHWIGHEPRMAQYGLDELTWEFDPVRAKALLTEAGFPDGFEIDMALPGIPWAPGADEAGQAVAPMWESVGISVTQQVTPYAAFRPGALVAREFAGVSTHGNSVPIEPISSDSLFYSSTSVINFGIEHPELQTLLEDALNTVNEEERWPKEAAVAKWAFDNIAYFTLYQSNLVWPIGPELGTWVPQGLQRSWLSNWEYAPHR